MNFLTLFYRSLGIFLLTIGFLIIHVLGFSSYNDSWLPRGQDFAVLTIGSTILQISYLVVQRYLLHTTPVFWSKAICWGAFSAFSHGVCTLLAYAGAFAIREPMLTATVGYAVIWGYIVFFPALFENPNRNLIRSVVIALCTAVLPVYFTLASLLGMLVSLDIGVPLFMALPFAVTCFSLYWMRRRHLLREASIVDVAPAIEVVDQPVDVEASKSTSNGASNV